MKHLAITFRAVTAFAVGCKPAAEELADENSGATAEQFDKVKKETRGATHEMKEYAYAENE